MAHGDFGNSLETYQVIPGSVWQAGNSHTFICGDVVQHFISGTVARYVPQVEAVYTDPPWSQGNRKMFHTYAGVDYPQDSFLDFIGALLAIIKDRCPSGLVAFEMGRTSFDMVARYFVALGATEWGTGTTYYGNPPRPLYTWIGTFAQLAQHNYISIPALHGEDTINWVMDRLIVDRKATSFFDPCCGNLNFALKAVARGATVYGCELIPAKLAQGLIKLADAGYTVEQLA